MYKKILVPVDLNEKGFSDKAVQNAVWHAQNTDAQIYLLNVVPGTQMTMVASYFPKNAINQMKTDVEQQLNQFAELHIPDGVKYKTYVAEGKPYKAILKYAAKLGVGLIIMPSHKQSKVDKVILGSVASKVVENSPVNVMVVKPNG
ncbi:universal stress protein [Alginatibacterium sediminis]|uniref:Universal stress protein n=1 Tax=Alginatibacterium sediminis TaxID=2164068 RepID=A0A420ECZ3_9ALTE|nr:universal stress protein [Alginatibacterium sediminis]RKF18524.1 universal stress protein [Alginatibacterium sediminis]